MKGAPVGGCRRQGGASNERCAALLAQQRYPVVLQRRTRRAPQDSVRSGRYPTGTSRKDHVTTNVPTQIALLTYTSARDLVARDRPPVSRDRPVSGSSDGIGLTASECRDREKREAEAPGSFQMSGVGEHHAPPISISPFCPFRTGSNYRNESEDKHGQRRSLQ